MTSPGRAVVACLAALLLLAAAGCGSDTSSKNDYVKSINQAQTDLLSNVQKVGSSTSGSDPAAAAKKTFTDLKAAIDKFVADLKAVDPPDQVKDLHNELISEISSVGTQVKQAGESLKSGDTQTIATAQSKLATTVTSLQTQMAKTIDDINKKLQS